MDVDYDKSYIIKSDITVQTLLYCGNYEDYGYEELKTKPVDMEKFFKCKVEDNLVELIDVRIVPVHLYIFHECNFITAEKDTLLHLNIIKNVHYFCKKFNFKTPQILSSAPQSCKKHTCKECNYKTSKKQDLMQYLTSPGDHEYKCKECDFKSLWKQYLKKHFKILIRDKYKSWECNYETVKKNLLKVDIRFHTDDDYKYNKCDYKTSWKHLKIHTGDEYKCKECDYKSPWKQHLKEHVKIDNGDEHKCDFEAQWKTNLQQHVKFILVMNIRMNLSVCNVIIKHHGNSVFRNI
ncbi:hypothetical protein FQA39_LY05697 [Lamprigera yunnana]|nr:hypothetical protein FQA39_LY05697 [Lamprigera yunnana]